MIAWIFWNYTAFSLWLGSFTGSNNKSVSKRKEKEQKEKEKNKDPSNEKDYNQDFDINQFFVSDAFLQFSDVVRYCYICVLGTL
jgi:hypothetical protein